MLENDSERELEVHKNIIVRRIAVFKTALAITFAECILAIPFLVIWLVYAIRDNPSHLGGGTIGGGIGYVFGYFIGIVIITFIAVLAIIAVLNLTMSWLGGIPIKMSQR